MARELCRLQSRAPSPTPSISARHSGDGVVPTVAPFCFGQQPIGGVRNVVRAVDGPAIAAAAGMDARRAQDVTAVTPHIDVRANLAGGIAHRLLRPFEVDVAATRSDGFDAGGARRHAPPRAGAVRLRRRDRPRRRRRAGRRAGGDGDLLSGCCRHHAWIMSGSVVASFSPLAVAGRLSRGRHGKTWNPRRESQGCADHGSPPFRTEYRRPCRHPYLRLRWQTWAPPSACAPSAAVRGCGCSRQPCPSVPSWSDRAPTR